MSAIILRRKAVRMADRIVKLTTAIVALLFSATAVLAQDRLTKENLVTLAVTLGVYDNRCERLAPRLADLQRMVRMLDKDEVMAGVITNRRKSTKPARRSGVVLIVRWSRSTRMGCSSGSFFHCPSTANLRNVAYFSPILSAAW